MKTVSGVITLVQEQRFKLVSDDGRTRLFVVARDAPVDGRDLQPLQRSQARVTVRYDDAADLIAGIAHDVVPASAAGRR